jgi:hypothetical protein
MKIGNATGREIELSETTISQIEQLTGKTIYRIIAEANLREQDMGFWKIFGWDPQGATELNRCNDAIILEWIRNLPWYKRIVYELVGVCKFPGIIKQKISKT